MTGIVSCAVELYNERSKNVEKGDYNVLDTAVYSYFGRNVSTDLRRSVNVPQTYRFRYCTANEVVYSVVLELVLVLNCFYHT